MKREKDAVIEGLGQKIRELGEDGFEVMDRTLGEEGIVGEEGLGKDDNESESDEEET